MPVLESIEDAFSSAPRRRWRLTVGARLTLGFGVTVALVVVLAVMALVQLHALSGQLKNMEVSQARRMNAVRTMQDRVSDAYSSMLALAIFTEKDELDFEADLQRRSHAGYLQSLKGVEAMLATDPPDSKARQMLLHVKQLGDSTWRDTEARLPALLLAGPRGETSYGVVSRARTDYDGWVASIRALAGQLASDNDAAIAQVQAGTHVAGMVLVSTALMAVLVGVLAAWKIRLGITGPLQQAVSVAQAVAGGDLSADLQHDRVDELGELLDALAQMQAGLRSLVSQVVDTGDQITARAEDVADSSQALAGATVRCAGSLAHVAGSMARIAGTVADTSATVGHVRQLAGAAADVARQGGESVGRVADVMAQIDATSKEIGEIMSVIDGIAFQTNVLALNAAVEASRAGEQGRGFAVVAGDVRALAQRCAAASREVRQLVVGSNEKIGKGVTLVRESVQTMHGVLHHIDRVSGLTVEIAAAAKQQSDALNGVNGSVSQLDEMTQQNAKRAEAMSAAVQVMRESAQGLGRTAALFNLGRG